MSCIATFSCWKLVALDKTRRKKLVFSFLFEFIILIHSLSLSVWHSLGSDECEWNNGVIVELRLCVFISFLVYNNSGPASNSRLLACPCVFVYIFSFYFMLGSIKCTAHLPCRASKLWIHPHPLFLLLSLLNTLLIPKRLIISVHHLQAHVSSCHPSSLFYSLPLSDFFSCRPMIWKEKESNKIYKFSCN